MTNAPADPLAVIAAPAPPVDAAAAVRIAREHYNLSAEARELVSERDRNFHLVSDDGRAFVLKIANAAEHPGVTDFQVRALLHIAAHNTGIAVPEVVPTRDGCYAFELETGAGPHVTRLVTFLDGVVMRSRPLTTVLARNFGGYAARLGSALRGFEHASAGHALLWDMQRVERVCDLVECIEDAALRARVSACLDDFLETILPRFAGLRAQVVHNDLNPDNVLLEAHDASKVAGVIDFGDMLSAPLIVDVAVAASYLRAFDGDPLRYIRAFVEAYHAVVPLEREEIALLPNLVRVRLAMTTAILHWRLGERGPDDPYLGGAASSESTAARFLARLDELPETRGGTAFQPLL